MNAIRIAARLCAVAILTTFFLAPYLFAQTKIRLHDAASDISGYKKADLVLGPANTTAITNTAASGTDILVTKTGAGASVAWITAPIKTAFTLSGTVTCNIYGGESNAAANTEFRCRLYKYSGGSEGAAFAAIANPGPELTTTTSVVHNWTGSPTSTSFAIGDRLVIKLYVENCSASSGCPTGTMAASYTVTAGYDGTTDGSNAASWIQTTETIAWAYLGTPPTESNTTTDSIAIIINKAISETTPTCTGTVTGSHCAAEGLIETNVGPDSVTAIKGSGQAGNVSETNTTSDSLAILKSYHVAISETVSESESVSYTAQRAVGVSVSLTTTPSITGAAGRVGNPTESLTTTPSVATTRSLHVAMTDTTSGSDSDAASTIHSLQVSMSEAQTTTPSVAEIHAAVGPLSETLTTTPSVSASKSGSPSVTENLTCTQSVSVSHCAAKGLTETNVGPDSVIAIRPSGKVGNLTETLSPSYSVAISRSMHGSLTETLTTTDSVAELPAHFSSISETHATSDFLAGGKQNQITLTEVVVESDSLSAQPAHYANFVESLTTVDGLSVTHCGALLESLTTADVLSKQRTANANMTETLTVSDSIHNLLGRMLTETHATNDALAAGKPGNTSVNLNDALSTSDSLAQSRAMHGALTESNTTTASVSVVHLAFAQIPESLTTSGSLTAVAAHVAGITELHATIDQVAAQAPHSNSIGINENLTTTALLAGNRQLQKSISETVTESDSANAKRGPVVAMSESLVTADSLSTGGARHLFVAFTESYPTSASTSMTAPHVVSITESLSHLDAVQYSVGGRRIMIIDSQ